MNKTLKISFSLKNTYRVNGILFSLKQIPLLKRLLPETLYKIKGLKIFANTHLFNPTKDKYYAMILMRMDAREYTLVNYFYSILKVALGFLPFTILFGMGRGVPLWFCLLLPLCIVGMKLFAAAVTLWDYEKRGFGYNENKLSKYVWGCINDCILGEYSLWYGKYYKADHLP